jgi:hypothetical protein
MMNIEKAKEIHSSELWTHIVDEIEYRIHCELQLLKTAPLDKVPFIQQKIQVLEQLKTLPQSVVEREE